MSVITNYGSTTNSNEYCESYDTQEFKINNPNYYVNNVVDLPLKSEESVISFLRDRFERDLYYTWAGRSLIGIRPYTNNCKSNHIDDVKTPSIESIVSQAIFRLEHQIGKCNQSVIITGESGSGKTYSLAVALKHIAKIQNNSETSVRDLLKQSWYTVPLLTAFGNAATSQNGDSSRFGQLFQLQYDNFTNLTGLNVKTFLLEKSRVSGPNYGEGNFHIFKQILNYESNDFLRTLCLSKNINYKICCNKLDTFHFNENTSHLYEETLEAMEYLDINRNKIDIYKILSTILNLGNVRFCVWNDNYVVTVDSMVHIENVAKLLETNVEHLKNIFTTRIVSVNNRTSIYKVVCATKTECESRRDVLMRYLYEKLFIWIVKTVNKTISKTPRCNPLLGTRLGIVDIYGFETFETNLFEQLCINYANEKLQWYFVDNYFQEEDYFDDALKSEFREEFHEEYRNRISLFEASLFNILNEICLSKRKSDADGLLMVRLNNELKNEKHFFTSINTTNEFTIKHYAGSVVYDARNMVTKNTDKVTEEFVQVLRSNCNFSFLKMIVKDDVLPKMQTTLTKFKKSLNKLINVLNEGDVHYIKCIKTNNYHIANYLDDAYFKNQLYANGIFEILKLSFQGYSIKLPWEYYGCYFKSILPTILQDSSLPIYCGAKYIFMNQNEYILLKKLHNFIQFYAATKIKLFLREHKVWKTNDKEFNLKKSRSNTKLNVCKRKLYRTDNLATYFQIPNFKIVFHTSKTCILNSHMLPRHTRSKGLSDIL